MAENRVSINVLEKYCDSVDSKDFEITFPEESKNSITFKVKKRLSLKETMEYIEDVVSQSVIEEDLMIIPVSLDYINKRNILTYYANFTMPSNVNKSYDLVMSSSNLINAILNVIDKKQYNMIQKCIRERFEFERNKMLSTQTRQIQEVINKIENMTDSFSTMFDGVSGEQMSRFISNISAFAQNNKMTPQDLANAVVESLSKK